MLLGCLGSWLTANLPSTVSYVEASLVAIIMPSHVACLFAWPCLFEINDFVVLPVLSHVVSEADGYRDLIMSR
jgi:hypothetical protein